MTRLLYSSTFFYHPTAPKQAARVADHCPRMYNETYPAISEVSWPTCCTSIATDRQLFLVYFLCLVAIRWCFCRYGGSSTIPSVAEVATSRGNGATLSERRPKSWKCSSIENLPKSVLNQLAALRNPSQGVPLAFPSW